MGYWRLWTILLLVGLLGVGPGWVEASEVSMQREGLNHQTAVYRVPGGKFAWVLAQVAEYPVEVSWDHGSGLILVTGPGPLLEQIDALVAGEMDPRAVAVVRFTLEFLRVDERDYRRLSLPLPLPVEVGSAVILKVPEELVEGFETGTTTHSAWMSTVVGTPVSINHRQLGLGRREGEGELGITLTPTQVTLDGLLTSMKLVARDLSGQKASLITEVKLPLGQPTAVALLDLASLRAQDGLTSRQGDNSREVFLCYLTAEMHPVQSQGRPSVPSDVRLAGDLQGLQALLQEPASSPSRELAAVEMGFDTGDGAKAWSLTAFLGDNNQLRISHRTRGLSQVQLHTGLQDQLQLTAGVTRREETAWWLGLTDRTEVAESVYLVATWLPLWYRDSSMEFDGSRWSAGVELQGQALSLGYTVDRLSSDHPLHVVVARLQVWPTMDIYSRWYQRPGQEDAWNWQLGLRFFLSSPGAGQ
ncbi:MAG: hypothetical protein GX030_09180 [Firmicutes bacterium]|nr:hypothetical protein [Bacillota bacterium]